MKVHMGSLVLSGKLAGKCAHLNWCRWAMAGQGLRDSDKWFTSQGNRGETRVRGAGTMACRQSCERPRAWAGAEPRFERPAGVCGEVPWKCRTPGGKGARACSLRAAFSAERASSAALDSRTRASRSSSTSAAAPACAASASSRATLPLHPPRPSRCTSECTHHIVREASRAGSAAWNRKPWLL